jgi:glutathione-regulated potassium-efflux system ancillary protein KefF
MIDLVYAHPYPDRSIANRALVAALAGLPGLRLASLYDLYPDWAIDVDAEQAALASADLLVLQHPMHWYGCTPMMKLWLDKVLALGWAYGKGGTALRGKTCLWVVTTGGDEASYSPEGLHAHALEAFAVPMRQTAALCGMRFVEPFVLHAAHRRSPTSLAAAGRAYRERLVELTETFDTQTGLPALEVGA